METVYLTFLGELNEFLPQNHRGRAIERRLRGLVSVKHLIESNGVPHTEVERIDVNGTGVGFSYLPRPGDRITVQPPRQGAERDAEDPLSLLPAPPRPYRFLLDNHLGRLAAYLRLLGFDSLYDTALDDAELAMISHQEERILLTRDRGLLMRRVVKYGCCLRTREPRTQLRAVIARFGLAEQISPWQRCLRCNGQLVPVEKAAILHRLEPKTIKYYNEFHQCQACWKLYWKGSHYLRMLAFLEGLNLAG